MNAATKSAAPGRVFLLGATAVVLLPLLYLINSTAQLVNQLGIDRSLATTIVNILISWGPDVLLQWFPWLAPFIGILKLLLGFGAEVVIGF